MSLVRAREREREVQRVGKLHHSVTYTIEKDTNFIITCLLDIITKNNVL